ncbi:MAG TPA: outer membrane protein assembly factor BamA [Longimicrobium sp.]|nr:outer membrane protein assembly factor BamA [Longimicrobium sp.]
MDTVLVRGNVRLTEAQVRGAGGIHSGSFITPTQVPAAINRLMNTGQFESVDVLFRPVTADRGAIVLQVRERPLLGDVSFQGLKSVSGGTVRDSAKLKAGEPLNPQRVRDAEKLVRDLLAKKGVQLTSIDTTLRPMPNPAHGVRLTFNVREGGRLAIADVDFRGNRAFGDDKLEGAMATKEEGFFWFRGGRFDREVFNEDLRANLPSFYAKHGYIDFAVVRDTLEVDPATGKARLVIEVNEGPQYRLGELTVVGNSRFPTDDLRRLLTTQRRSVLGLPFGGTSTQEAGEVFDRAALDEAVSQAQKLYRNEGYLYAQVEPVVERVPAQAGRAPTVNVTMAVSERSPFYIRNIAIEGNTTTHESVIRDRLWLLPGDVYNEDRVYQSYQSINGLGFFESPMPMPDINPDPETGQVDLVFHVKEKQTGNLNFGTVFGGGYGGNSGRVAGFIGYQQPNLFGQGKQAALRAEYGYGRSTFEASYTDPALAGTRNSGSFSVYRRGDRYVRFGNGRRLVTGGSVNFGIPVPGSTRTRAFLGYSLSNTSYNASENEECGGGENQSIFCLDDALASRLALSLTRDTKNHPLFPTQGVRESISLEQTGGPLGGTGNYQKVQGEAEWWAPVAAIGGGPRPIRMALGVRANAGTIFGEVGPFPFERFYIGGVQTSQPLQLRGYQEFSIGPRGYDVNCRNRFLQGCLGDSFLTMSGELAVRVSDILSVHAFSDAGNVYDDVRQFDPTRLFRSAGVGGTLVTPFLGAIGVDAAYGFDRDQPGWQVHFRLGNQF